jgi:hypothetical protein
MLLRARRVRAILLSRQVLNPHRESVRQTRE